MATSNKYVELGAGKIHLSVVKGDLTEEQADVLVCTTSKNLDLCKGRASKFLMEAAGDGIQEECHDRYPGGIEYTDVAVVGPWNLRCKKVFFVALPVWASGNNEEEGLLSTISKCCQLAASDGFRSLTLPALGSGFLRYPLDLVAKTTFQSVENFSNKQSKSSLKKVTVIVFHRDDNVYKAFVKEAQRRASGSCNHNNNGSNCKALKLNPRAAMRNAPIGIHSIISGRAYHRQQSMNELKVNIMTGNLAHFQADVIVNNTKMDLQLKNGGMSETLLECAGAGLQRECDSRYPDGLRPGEVAITDGYGLLCKKVYHGSIPKWDKGYNSKKTLCRFVCKCLSEASAEGHASIAFPALGTGSQNFPASVTARTMMKCIREFMSNNEETSLSTVTVLIYDGDKDHKTVLREFQKEYEIMKGQLKKNGEDSEEEEAKDDGFSDQFMAFKLEMAMKNAMERSHPRGSLEWFKNMYKSDPRSPSYWTEYHKNKTLKDWVSEGDDVIPMLVPVDQDSFEAIKKIVEGTWLSQKVGQGQDARGLSDLNYTRISVKKVERIENCELFEKYAQKRQEFFHKGIKRGKCSPLERESSASGPILTTKHMPADDSIFKEVYGEVNEHYLFHGTKESSVKVIIKQGLDSRLSGTSTMFGPGVYMAESSTKADQYADPVSSRSKGEKKMLLVRAVLGSMHVQNTAKSFARAPCFHCKEDKCTCTTSTFYGSVIGDGTWIFREFVVYDRQQVYPEYVITYDRV